MRGHSSGEDLPPVDEPADIDGQPAVRHLDFDSPHGELIDEGDNHNKAHADHHALEQAGLTPGSVDSPIEMLALCSQPKSSLPIELYRLQGGYAESGSRTRTRLPSSVFEASVS